MSVAQAETWAANMTIERMEQRIRETELWIAEVNETIVGWVAVRGDYVDGLYVDPAFAGQGIGTELLALAERLMRERGVQTIRLDASWNSEEFYIRRSYEPTGPRPAADTRQFVKKLSGWRFAS